MKTHRGNCEKVAPGMIKYVSGADDVHFGTPASSGGYGDYTKTQLHAIATGAGVMYSQMTGSLSDFNFRMVLVRSAFVTAGRSP